MYRLKYVPLLLMLFVTSAASAQWYKDIFNTGTTPAPAPAATGKTTPTTTPTTTTNNNGRNGSTGATAPTSTTTTTTTTTTTNGRNGSTGNTNTTTTTTTTQSNGRNGSTGNTNTTTTNTTTNPFDFTQNEAAKAIKEALTNGITTGVNKVSVTDGFFKNLAIKIPFPKEAAQVESTLRQIGLGKQIDQVVLSINRAAESAAKAAMPIFINSIKQMTITDAINIVGNQQPDAATQFLQRTTTDQLVTAFKPSIKTALDKTLATKYWTDVMTRYNKIPFVTKVNTDLTDYVTRKAISGLFYMIAQEEAKIRKDPVARTTDILDKVFGSTTLKKR